LLGGILLKIYVVVVLLLMPVKLTEAVLASRTSTLKPAIVTGAAVSF